MNYKCQSQLQHFFGATHTRSFKKLHLSGTHFPCAPPQMDVSCVYFVKRYLKMILIYYKEKQFILVTHTLYTLLEVVYEEKYAQQTVQYSLYIHYIYSLNCCYSVVGFHILVKGIFSFEVITDKDTSVLFPHRSFLLN